MSKMAEIVDAARMAQIDRILEKCSERELVTIRAKINGKIGKRSISPEAQAKMQAGRKKKPTQYT